MIEIILTSSVLILLLVLLRRALRGRINPGVQYALWLLVALRLLIPGTLFPSPVSLVGAAEGLQAALHETFPDPDDLPEPVINEILDQLPQQSIQPAIPSQAGRPDGDVVVHVETIPPAVTQRVYNWPDILWKTGMIVTGGAMALSNLAFSLRLRKTRKRLALPAAVWSGALPVYEADGIPSPCLFGLPRPAIYFNEAAMDAAHQEHVLAHEYAHYRHGDHVWAILRCVCLAVHWYNPLVWWAAALSRRDCELACDAAALRRLGEDQRIDYGQTLLGMVSKRRSPSALLHTATTMTAGKRAMAERVALIVRQPRTRKITLALVALLACVLAACSFGGKAAAAGLPAECFGVYAPEYWTGGIVQARYYISPRDTSIRIAVREDYFGFVDENGEAVELEKTGLPSIHDPVYAKRKISLYQLMETGYSTSASYAAQGVWSGYLQDKNSVAFYDVRSGGEDSGVTLTIVDGQVILSYMPEDSPALYYFLNPAELASPIDLPPVPVSVTVSLPYAGPDSGSVISYYNAAMVERLWDFYQSFQFDGPTELEAGDGLPAEVSFQGDFGTTIAHFQVLSSGKFTDFENGYQILHNGAEIYGELYRLVTRGADAPETDVPAAVWLGEMLSSQYRPGAVTDPEIVSRLWALYQGFTFTGEPEDTLRGTGWSVTVSFRDSENNELAHFDIWDSGQCWLEDDYETFYVLQDGKAIYHAFCDASRTAPRDESFAAAQWSEPGPSGPALEAMEANARTIVEKVRQGAEVRQWLPLMGYMDWAFIRQAAVEAGLDAAETEQQVVEAIYQYISQKNIALTQGEYVSILTATSGLTGTPKEGGYRIRSDNVFPLRYGDIVYSLFTVNPSLFAYVVLAHLPEEQQSEVLDFFRYECRDWIEFDRGTFPNFKQAPDQEEAVAALEKELERGVSATPGEMTLVLSGQSFRFLPVNAYGVYAATYTSSDPSVAEAAQDGTVTAVNSGEADITMHFEGAQGQHDFICHVRCNLEYGSAAAAESIRSYVKAGISPKEWLLLLGATSWSDIAVPPEGDNRHDWIMDVQRAIYDYILDSDSRGGTPLTDLEIFTLLISTKELDGAYAEGYAWILYTLYNQEPTRFATIALDEKMLPEQREETMGLLLYEWGYYHRTEDGRPYRERLEELLARLEEDRKGELALSPDALVFSDVGEVRLLKKVNDANVASYSCESSDPEVVTAKAREDDRFELQAVGQGEAVVTVRCTMADGAEKELTCSVLCAW